MDKKKLLAMVFTTLLIISIFSAVAVNSVKEDIEKEVVLIRTKEANDIAQLESVGGEIIHEYDSFVLVELDSNDIPQIENMGLKIERMKNRDYVGSLSNSFNVKDGVPDIPDELKIGNDHADEINFYIVQFIGPIETEWLDEIRELGGGLQEFRHRFNYIIEMDSSTRYSVEELDFVRWVGMYQPAYKLDVNLMERSGPLNVDVYLFNSGNTMETVETIMKSGGVVRKTVGAQHIQYMHVEIDGDNLVELANSRQVKAIIPAEYQDEFVNYHATWVAQTNEYENRKVTDMGVTGEGELITVVDSELNGGSASVPTPHEAFADPDSDHEYLRKPVGDEHRKVQAHYVPGDANGDLDNGVHHGSHVAGTVLGNSPPYDSYSNHDGNAMDARLIFQDIAEGTSPEPPSDMYHDSWADAHNRGSRTYTHSWGGGQGYVNMAIEGDAFTWDHIYSNILFAMGNNGPDEYTLFRQSEGKNIISVGAVDEYTQPEDIPSWSSRGYATDGRIKPTILHVGRGIYSASSVYGDEYRRLSGTSMATPGIAGQVAQVRQYYRDGWYPSGNVDPFDGFNPTNALVRATLINGAVEISGEGAYQNDNRFPNGDQGYGRSKLDRVMHFEGDERKLIAYDSWSEGLNLSTGQSWKMDFHVDDPSQELEITLGWTDWPGNEGSDEDDPAIVNDLDIEVTAPDGTRYVGNAFTGYNPGYSEPNPTSNPWSGLRSGEFDGLNVEENVLLLPDQNGVDSGTYNVRVTAYNVPSGELPFAIVVSGGVREHDGNPPEVTLTKPNGGEEWHARTEEEITWTTEDGDDPVDSTSLAYSIDDGETWKIIETGLEDTGSYTWALPNEHSSDCVVRIRATDTSGRRKEDTNDVVFSIIGVPPESPTNLGVEHISKWIEVIYDDDVEGGDLGYTNQTSHDDASEWGIRQHGATSGENSWDFGDGEYNSGSDGMLSALISPEITIPSDANEEYGVWLTFKHWYDFYSSAERIDDGGNVKISTQGIDGPWSIITPEEGYDGTIRDAYGQPLGGEPGWGGTRDWIPATFDLTDYKGESIYLRWDAGVRKYSSAGAGWRIDDILMDAQIFDEEDDKDNRITWAASPDEDIGEVSHYKIYRSDDPGGPWDGSTFVDTVEAVDQSSNYSYVDYEKGMPDGIFWWYVVRAVGTNGLEDQNTDAVQEPGGETETFDIPLSAGGDAGGWNFVSFNLIPTDTSLEAILADIDGNYDRVMYYDSSTGEWSSYVPGRAERYNNLQSWSHRMGIWIRMTTGDTLTIEGSPPASTDITLYSGWTMVGLPSETAGNHGLPGEVDRVGYFDDSQTYNLAYDYSPEAFSFEPGKGYWVHNPTDTAVVWTVDY